ncbi:putative transposase [Klebsiella pneumoniae]|nr:putative transposase [Klebsiella pneumoniae]
MPCQCPHYGRWPQHDFTALKKLRPEPVTSRIQPGSDVIVCAEMDEQWGYVGAKSRQRWLFYAYDRMRRTVVAHVSNLITNFRCITFSFLIRERVYHLKVCLMY